MKENDSLTLQKPAVAPTDSNHVVVSSNVGHAIMISNVEREKMIAYSPEACCCTYRFKSRCCCAFKHRSWQNDFECRTCKEMIVLTLQKHAVSTTDSKSHCFCALKRR